MWNRAPWAEMEELLKTSAHMAAFVALAEADDVSVGYALEKYMDLRGNLELLRADLPHHLGRKLEDITDDRDTLFFWPWPCLANFLDPRFRGQKFAPERLRTEGSVSTKTLQCCFFFFNCQCPLI